MPAGTNPPEAAAAAAVASAVDRKDDDNEPSAADRLELSRARLRLALLEIAHPAPKASLLDQLPGMTDLKTKAMHWLSTLPGAALVLDSLDSWWQQHPLRTAGAVAREAGEQVLAPVARRNPYAFVLGAAALGAVVVLTKPWRWLLRPALFVGLVPQIASHAMRRMPIDTWIRMASSLTARKPGAGVPPTRTAGAGPL
jgi:hypothetical protein